MKDFVKQTEGPVLYVTADKSRQVNRMSWLDLVGDIVAAVASTPENEQPNGDLVKSWDARATSAEKNAIQMRKTEDSMVYQLGKFPSLDVWQVAL